MALLGDTPDPNQVDPAVPDWLVTTRQFVGTLDRTLNDQAYANTDGLAYNPTGQFVNVGPQGTAVEGRPIALTSAGGVTVSPGMTMALLGAAAFWFFTRHKG